MKNLLTQFAASQDPHLQRAALVALIKTKQIHKAAQDNSFNEGLRNLGQAIKESKSAVDTLTAAATLERAAALVKPLRQQIDELLKESITTQLPSLQHLSDKNDRQYAARTWRAVRSPWYVDYLAETAVQEESGENIRRECLEGIIAVAGDVSVALSEIQQAFTRTKFITKKPGDSAGRRLTRVLGLFTSILLESQKSLGRDVGRKLSLLVRRTFRETGLPQNDQIKRHVTHQIAKLIHEFVRTSFSYATQDKTYEALLVVKGWFHISDWVELCETSDSIAHLQNDLRESIVLLARAGVFDDGLHRTLGVALGSNKRSKEVCKEIATTTPGLDQAVRNRLAGVLPRRKIASATESQEWSVDEILAELMIETDRLSTAATMVRMEVLPKASTSLPCSVRAISNLSGLADAFSNRMALALRRRSLYIRGEAGEEVEYSHIEHQIKRGEVPTRRVRIVSPIVERISVDGVPQIVRRALVEPISDQT